MRPPPSICSPPSMALSCASPLMRPMTRSPSTNVSGHARGRGVRRSSSHRPGRRTSLATARGRPRGSPGTDDHVGEAARTAPLEVGRRQGTIVRAGWRIIAALLDVRRHHPTWGAKKLLKIVATRHPTWTLPARSTVCDLLDRAGLITGSRRRPVPAHPGRPLIPMTAPNGTWTADFKGQFKTRDGVYCYPLTIVDGFSRYLLTCHGLLSTAIVTARPLFLRLFQEYGLPGIIRTDNGVPFATTALGRLSRFGSGSSRN